MDLKQIHELIKIVNKSNIGEISIEDKDGKVTIKQKEEAVVTVAAPQPQVYTTAPQQAARLHLQQQPRQHLPAAP
jgi:acetyl-CoA carboxylase biotin carboxyl carrier protein